MFSLKLGVNLLEKSLWRWFKTEFWKMKNFGHSIFKLISSYVCHEVSGSHPAPPPTVLDIDDLLRSLVLRFHFLSFRNWNMPYSHQKRTFRGPGKVRRPTWTPILPKKMIPPTLGKSLAPWASSQACMRAVKPHQFKQHARYAYGGTHQVSETTP